MAVDQALKIRETRLRRAARRQRLVLTKIRRYDRRAADYGTYNLADMLTGAVIARELSINEVAERLGDE